MTYPRVDDQVSLIQAIQSLRQYQAQPELPKLAERRGWMDRLVLLLKKETDPELFYAGQVIEGLLERFCLAENQFLPQGLVVILSPRIYSLRMTLERLCPALLYGNVVLVKLSSEVPQHVEILESLLLRAGVPTRTIAFSAEPRVKLEPLLTGHPAVRGVSIVGRHSTAVSLAKSLELSRCHFQAWTGGLSSLLILDEPALVGACEFLRKSLTTLDPTSAFFPSKVFVLDQFLPQARAALVKLLTELPGAANGMTADGFESLLQQVRAESATILCQGPPALIENLPNCSELQQVPLAQPILQLTSVKYPHEMAKWVNNNYYGFMATIFGELERARKIAQKLEVGLVNINKGFDPGQTFLFGMKESVMGETESASFFYQRRQITDAFNG